MRNVLAFFLSLLFTLYYDSTFSSNLEVVATIKPVHSLAASVTDGMLAYDHVLKPSDASNLESSDVIFYVDDKCLLKLSLKAIWN
jgi:zinc transport system substrate-binding protein